MPLSAFARIVIESELPMRIPCLAGRTLTWQDAKGAPLVAVINETMARDHFGGAAIGRHFAFESDQAPIEMVGVVADGKYVGLREDRIPRFAYASFLQTPVSAEMVLHVRTEGDPLRQIDAVPMQLRALDPTLPLSGVTTLDEQVADSLSAERILATLGTAFSALALLLAAVGVYGVLTCAVASRTREIGVRMALGARPGDVVRLILRQVALMGTAGWTAGALCAWALQGVLGRMRYGIRPADAAVIGGTVAVLALTGLLAAWRPAWRAARLDPLLALRHE